MKLRHCTRPSVIPSVRISRTFVNAIPLIRLANFAHIFKDEHFYCEDDRLGEKFCCDRTLHNYGTLLIFLSHSSVGEIVCE